MTDETAETVCEAFERLTAGNSRFIGAPRTGQAIAIIGGRPIGAAAADAGQAAPEQLILREQAEHSRYVEDVSGFQIDETAAVVGRHEVCDR